MKLIKMLGIILVISLSVYYLSRYLIKIITYPTRYKEIVEIQANKSEIDPYLVFAIIKKESKFNKNAISNKDAKGLMQIMDSTASDILKANTDIFTTDQIDIFDAKINISIGTIYLKQLVDRYNGDIVMAVAAYNAGLGNVDKWKKDSNIFQDGTLIIDNIPFEETRNYTSTVIKYYNGYKRSYEK